MSSVETGPARIPIRNVRDYLVVLFSVPGAVERFSAEDIDDAIGVFAVNGVKV